MKKIISPVLLLLFVSLMIACNRPAETTTATSTQSFSNLEGARAILRENNGKFVEALQRGDSVAMAAMYTKDAWLLPQHSEPISGEDIQHAWGAAIRGGVKAFVFNTQDVTGFPDLLVETGKYETYGAGRQLLDRGKYITVWKRENGILKVYRLISNTSLAPPEL
jgi:ketosteroid isomerase-like protein